jgi:hypothetical protein
MDNTTSGELPRARKDIQGILDELLDFLGDRVLLPVSPLTYDRGLQLPCGAIANGRKTSGLVPELFNERLLHQ